MNNITVFVRASKKDNFSNMTIMTEKWEFHMIQTNNNGNCYEENEGINLRFYEDVLDSAQMIHYLQKF